MSFDKTGVILALCALLPTAIVGYIAWQQTAKSHSDATITVRHEQVHENLDELLLAIKDSEASVRGYVITGKEEFLAPYLLESPKISAYEIRLDRSLDGEAEEKRLFKSLEPLVNAKMDHIARSLMIRQQSGLNAAAEFIAAGSGRVLMEKISNTITQMHDEQERAGAVKSKAPTDLYGLVRVTIILTVFALVLAGVNLFFLRFR